MAKSLGQGGEKVSGSAFAIIETGGKQYRVSPGLVLNIEKISEEKKDNEMHFFDKVLLISDGNATKIGTPYISGAKVEANIEGNGRAKKVSVVKYKAKSRYFKRRGHRQPFTRVKISSIG